MECITGLVYREISVCRIPAVFFHPQLFGKRRPFKVDKWLIQLIKVDEMQKVYQLIVLILSQWHFPTITSICMYMA